MNVPNSSRNKHRNKKQTSGIKESNRIKSNKKTDSNKDTSARKAKGNSDRKTTKDQPENDNKLSRNTKRRLTNSLLRMKPSKEEMKKIDDMRDKRRSNFELKRLNSIHKLYNQN